ncbi:hypothetical protein C2869_11165 [Saccharobesus litoralis]|uniref:Secreted protein n=1 Tax=Saccharobesus litoralis TaxID=2172099 RepID=A0A2S0VS17_9ALTE|nr:hypothetical protein [Saccharobesus litoralis]AWB66962.1 hypothetical protein C2869_11165 [Saccharobesus litoralis]
MIHPFTWRNTALVIMLSLHANQAFASEISEEKIDNQSPQYNQGKTRNTKQLFKPPLRQRRNAMIEILQACKKEAIKKSKGDKTAKTKAFKQCHHKKRKS